MGLAASKESTTTTTNNEDHDRANNDTFITSKLHGRQASIRQSTIRAKSKQPMPDPHELERRFTRVLVIKKLFCILFHDNTNNYLF